MELFAGTPKLYNECAPQKIVRADFTPRYGARFSDILVILFTRIVFFCRSW